MFIHLDVKGSYTIVTSPNTYDENGRYIKIIPVPEGINRTDLQALLTYLGYKEV